MKGLARRLPEGCALLRVSAWQKMEQPLSFDFGGRCSDLRAILSVVARRAAANSGHQLERNVRNEVEYQKHDLEQTEKAVHRQLEVLS